MKKRFTLIELLVVIAIIGVIVAMIASAISASNKWHAQHPKPAMKSRQVPRIDLVADYEHFPYGVFAIEYEGNKYLVVNKPSVSAAITPALPPKAEKAAD